jgi:phenylpyruvate tautomerase PptA (4-oxalocrotonate tautomerase family)
MANPMYGQNKADTEVAVVSDGDVFVKEYTATAAMGSDSGKVRCIELNHASTVIAITKIDGADYAGQVVSVKDTSASGTAAHTVTLASGTWNGTATVVTLNAPDECIVVMFDSAGDGTILVNVGSVALS